MIWVEAVDGSTLPARKVVTLDSKGGAEFVVEGVSGDWMLQGDED
jgi:hypothetical protein